MARTLLIVAIASVLSAACGQPVAGSDEAGAAHRPVVSVVPATTTTKPATTTTSTPATTSSTSVGSQTPTLATFPAIPGPAVAGTVAPVRLRIPSIGVDVAVTPVGVEDDGDMAVPPPEQAGWYRFGPSPGEQGSSVLAAHVDFDGERGAFFHLQDLEVGERLTVTLSDGSTESFTVTEVSQVPKDDLAGSGIFSRSGRPRIALVTCGGEFDESLRSYRDNVVAIADQRA